MQNGTGSISSPRQGAEPEVAEPWKQSLHLKFQAESPVDGEIKLSVSFS